MKATTGHPRVIRVDPPGDTTGQSQGADVAPPEADTGIPEGGTWLPAKDAAREASVSVSAVRKWYSKGRIPSRLEPGPTGDRRVVRLEDVVAQRDTRRDHGEAPKHATGPPRGNPEAPLEASTGDNMLVPRDAWDKVMSQLGHLHQAGQELAEEARARAKAETKVEFLQERMGELRAERDKLAEKVEVYRERLDHEMEPPPEPAPPRSSWWRRVWRGEE
jgi:hypothetical protein